ncbi:MAG: (2Fe-2S)-binding protein [Anaerolineae bacterium]|nr:(2Fe-2S)-binding protein [Anaerolineae bacterium]
MPTLRILHDATETVVEVAPGANLRQTLLAADISPYTTLTQALNCGGRGLCATCGVHLEAGAPPPQHWHDKLAAQFGYPRLSCQISIHHDLTVRIVDDKIIWGGRDADRVWKP